MPLIYERKIFVCCGVIEVVMPIKYCTVGL